MSKEYQLVKDGEMLAWLNDRPRHCDRGRVVAGIEARIWVSNADPWPRYYFNVQYGKEEIVEYLKAKKVDVEGAEWVEIDHGVNLIDAMSDIAESVINEARKEKTCDCSYCGGPVFVGEEEAFHLNDEGARDHAKDSDHQPLDPQGIPF